MSNLKRWPGRVYSTGAEPDYRFSFANERTALACQRTALSVLAGAAIMGRLTFDGLGLAALAMPGIAACLGQRVFIDSRWRYDQHFVSRIRRRPRGGRAGLSLTIGTALIAITQLLALGQS